MTRNIVAQIDTPLVRATAAPRTGVDGEAASKADFSQLRYAQCWEDADVLLEALDVQPDDVCLSIASAGDNTLALLAGNPSRVIALDLNPAQLASLELRVAAFRVLEHSELLELIGSRPSNRRTILYQRCRSLLSQPARRFWDGQAAAIGQGIGHAGKFERYLAFFRHRVLPLVHSKRRRAELLETKTRAERASFYARRWDTWRWKLVFNVFFSRFVLGRWGRDASFFDYVEGPVAPRILARARHALVELEPAENPYLHWIVTGQHGAALPFALREENFDPIRRNLDRLEWHCRSAEAYLANADRGSIDRFNMSDIFEYMSPSNYHGLLERLIHAGTSGGRVAYWNTLVDRHRPVHLDDRLRSLESLARNLHLRDKAFFYCGFVVEEIV